MQKSDFYKTASQCISKDYCDGHNAAVDELVDAGFRPQMHAHWDDFYWYGTILDRNVEICAKKCSRCCTINQNKTLGDYCCFCGAKMDEDVDDVENTTAATCAENEQFEKICAHCKHDYNGHCMTKEYAPLHSWNETCDKFEPRKGKRIELMEE